MPYSIKAVYQVPSLGNGTSIDQTSSQRFLAKTYSLSGITSLGNVLPRLGPSLTSAG